MARSILLPDMMDRVLAAGSTAILLATCVAVAKGRADWAMLPSFVWWHLATVLTVLALTPVMLMRSRGDRMHRMLGWIWVGSMFLTALLSFNIRLINQGDFSPIHILSIFTMIMAPLIVFRAKRGQIEKHRSAVRGMIIGALLIAGFFTFPVGRLLGTWLFS